jgi:heat shock protein HslJ
MSRIRVIAVAVIVGATLSVAVLASGQSTQKPDYAVVVPGPGERLPLNGTKWVLAGAKLPVPTPADLSRITLAFRSGTLTMSSGCNRGSTSYSVSPTHALGLSSTYVVTRMSCPGALEQWEPAFFRFLGAKPAITLDGNSLVLKTADAEMQFNRILPDPSASEPTPRQSRLPR